MKVTVLVTPPQGPSGRGKWLVGCPLVGAWHDADTRDEAIAGLQRLIAQILTSRGTTVDEIEVPA